MTKRVALYARVSTDQQTVENQLRDLQEVAGRLGWNVVDVITDEGISGAKGRDQRPGFDRLLKGIARREFDVIAAWSVDRLGRSLRDLVVFLDEVRDRGIDLYLHQQGVDTGTAAGRALFGMLSVFSDFERSMIRARVIAGLERAKSTGKRLGRPPTSPLKVEKVKKLLGAGTSLRAIARATNLSPAMVSKIKAQLVADGSLPPQSQTTGGA
ncbi:recombinase family protein [Magnetospirillum sulfuroxidans]|uniref:Recombinase family protein n=1 Tax=Magnetospirillum sulfuroxidans TaxID=611300 RepID=A0ABS5IHN8_9PROT|nr:recombinase family protein [Magnetospirillum sulfuroxidans]MBR9973914.1 recombinase family protein [Magnetospirillum sulfuroxidans]